MRRVRAKIARRSLTDNRHDRFLVQCDHAERPKALPRPALDIEGSLALHAAAVGPQRRRATDRVLAAGIDQPVEGTAVARCAALDAEMSVRYGRSWQAIYERARFQAPHRLPTTTLARQFGFSKAPETVALGHRRSTTAQDLTP